MGKITIAEMDTPTAAKILKRGSKLVEEDAQDLKRAYGYAISTLADMFLVESVVDDYMHNKINAGKAMTLIVQLVRNGRESV